MKNLGLRLHADEEHWIPLSDLMTGLMFLFLLIALAYMVEVRLHPLDTQGIERGAQTSAMTAVHVAQTRHQIYEQLYHEFYRDLPRWNATLDERTLSIRFYSPDVLFTTGSGDIRPQFKRVLDDFFPRYVRTLGTPSYRNVVSEIRIEGYTSASSSPGTSVLQSYITNMNLSQTRARSVLDYVLPMPAVAPQRAWLMQVLSATGFSFSHLRHRSNGSVDEDASQRVEFRVETNVAAAPAAQPQQTHASQIVARMDAAPSWAGSIVGKQLRALFPVQTAHCEGYLDSVSPVSPDGSATLSGWAFDLDASKPIDRIVLTTADGSIVGAGNGGFQRLDVPAVRHEVTTQSAGWNAYVAAVPHSSVSAWAVMNAPGTVCRLVGVAF
jgi:outer membrane protein OmpA-like peptidoglycan-associated protein